MFDIIVIGAGLIGSAAIRTLSESHSNVAIVGPAEPKEWANHEGVFASHYDQGRITRILADDRVWATLARRSIAQYALIEHKSGITFHYPVGGLQVGHPAEDFIAKTEAVGRELGLTFESYEPEALAEAEPLFTFAAGLIGVRETAPAGYINPRSLVQAQLTIAAQQGATISREMIAGMDRRKGFIELKGSTGQIYQARKVLLTTGAFTNMLLAQPLKLIPKARTILLAELPPAEIERLRDLPTLIYENLSEPILPHLYLLPPIQYPDGKTYLKMGGENSPVEIIDTFETQRAWFRSGGDPAHAAELKEMMLSLIPNLQAISFQMKPCVITATPHRYPYIEALEPGQVYAAVGGCGASAKSSNEIGRLAARLVVDEVWADDLTESLFQG